MKLPLQSNQVKRTPQETINEFIIQKLNSLLVVDFRLISALLQGILVLPHSRTPTVDVRISFANRTTWGAAGAVFFSQIFSGTAILQSSRLFRPQLAVYSGFEPATSRSAVWYATNSANHSRNPAPLTKYPGFLSQSGSHYAKPSGNLGLNINGTLCEGGNVLEKLGHLWPVGPVRLKLAIHFSNILASSSTWLIEK